MICTGRGSAAGTGGKPRSRKVCAVSIIRSRVRARAASLGLVPDEDIADGVGVGGVEHRSDLVDRKIHAAKIADLPGHTQLVTPIAPVGRPRVHLSRLEQPDLVVVAQGGHGEPTQGGEPPDLEQGVVGVVHGHHRAPSGNRRLNL